MVKSLTIDDMHLIADKKSGKFLSSEYTTSKKNYKWQCFVGHVWEAAPSNIKKGGWCPRCAGVARLTAEDMHEIAKSRNGKLISSGIITARTVCKWQCVHGHVWNALCSSIKQGSWCPRCRSDKQKLTIKDMQNLAEKRGGKFISLEYINSQTNHKWQCNIGHIWKAKPNNIQTGQWCPSCTPPYRGEEICREIISKIFGELFVKCKPDFLKNKSELKIDNRKTLELDGFAKNLNMAFEYHGIQHFIPVSRFGGDSELIEIQKRDKLKLELCAKVGVRVVVVPTFPTNFDKLTCQHIVETAIIAAGIEMPPTWERAAHILFQEKALQIGR